MPQPNYYLGSVSDLASNMGSMFGTNSTQGTSTGIMQPQNPIQIARPNQGQGTIGNPGSVTPAPQQPVTGSLPAGSTNSTPTNPWVSGNYQSQAVRPTSFGNFDPAYGQNLASFIGNTFENPTTVGNSPLQFNPYGNLTDANVSYPNVGGGNAPLPGLPQTLLSWAQMFNPGALFAQGSGIT